MNKTTEALKLAEEIFSGMLHGTDWNNGTHANIYRPKFPKALAAIREVLAEQEKQEPVAWCDHVEHRLLTWRQSFVNRSGDQLALDDFMDQRSLEDLIDFVCDEYTAPTPRKPEPVEQEPVHESLQIAAVALQDIACSSQTNNLLWWQIRAREAQKQIAERLTNSAPAEPVKQEPVAWMDFHGNVKNNEEINDYIAAGWGKDKVATYSIPLYAVPVQPVKQEPVAWVAEDVCKGQFINGKPRRIFWECIEGSGIPLYTNPPSVEAAIEATKEKAAKVCELVDTDAFGKERPTPEDCAAAIRSMK